MSDGLSSNLEKDQGLRSPHRSEKLLRQLQALPLIVGLYLLTVQLIRRFNHVFKNQSSNSLTVIEHKRNIMASNLKNDLTIVS